MAAANPSTGKSSASAKQGSKQEKGTKGIGSPISNEAYNVITALQAKLEGLEAYRKYAKDGDASLWEEMTEADVECVSRLADELERMVRDGEFRLQA
jgi:hypothetical protein